MRSASASSAALGSSGSAGRMSSSWGGNGGLIDRLRALAGWRVRMMPLRGWAAAASSGR